MSENRTAISAARSYREIGEYWDQHDLAEFWDQTRSVEIELDIPGWGNVGAGPHGGAVAEGRRGVARSATPGTRTPSKFMCTPAGVPEETASAICDRKGFREEAG